jgi:hypothetical protein
LLRGFLSHSCWHRGFFGARDIDIHPDGLTPETVRKILE